MWKPTRSPPLAKRRSRCEALTGLHGVIDIGLLNDLVTEATTVAIVITINNRLTAILAALVTYL
jgi:hypothetical protein